MDQDINVPKTKSVSIFFHFFKLNIYTLLIYFLTGYMINNWDNTETCSVGGLSNKTIIFQGNVAMGGINLIALIFIWLREPFARIEFFIMYFLNLVFSLMLCTSVLVTIKDNPVECMSLILL